jgi:hypothetical protein
MVLEIVCTRLAQGLKTKKTVPLKKFSITILFNGNGNVIVINAPKVPMGPM